MENQDIHWKQRFANFEKALKKLTEITLLSENGLTDIEKEGLIQRFEFTHELAWNVMKDFLKHKGIVNLIGSRDATRLAFQNEIIEKGQVWMDMIDSRNQTVHTYNESVLETEFIKITKIYYPEFIKFEEKMKSFL